MSTSSPSPAVAAADTLLAAAPPTPGADAALAGPRRVSNRRDELDGYGRSDRRFAALPAEAQAELALSVQWCTRARAALDTREITGPSRRRVQRELERRSGHLEALVGSVFRLVRTIVRDKVRARLGDDAPRVVIEDMLSEAYCVVIECAQRWDPARGITVATFVASRLRSELGGTLRSMLAPINPPQSWHRVAALGAGVDSSLSQRLGREPTPEEFRSALEEACEHWALEHLSETEAALAPEARAERVRAKLIKQGTARALADYDEVAAKMRAATSLDLRIGEEDSPTVGEGLVEVDDTAEMLLDALDGARVAALVADAVADLDEDVAAAVCSRLAGDDSDGRGAAAVAVRGLRGRLAAPHAQYAALVNLEAQCSVAPVAVGHLDALEARLSRAGRGT